MSSAVAAKKSTSISSRSALFLVGLLIIGAVIAAIMLMTAPKNAFASDQTVTVYHSVMIQSGDTLWDLANEYKPEGVSVNSYISQIKSVNSMSSDRIVSGEYIILPVQIPLDEYNAKVG